MVAPRRRPVKLRSVGSSVVRPIPIALLLVSGAALAAEPARYTLRATLDPAAHRIVLRGSLRDPSGRVTPIDRSQLIERPIAREGEDYARGFAETTGTIQSEGVFLSGASGWYPPPPAGSLLTFELEVTLPAGWDAMSQGRRTVHERTPERTRVVFVSDDPQEEIWLVAGPWTETARRLEGIDAIVLQRERDDALAASYLEATGRYVAMYGRLLGPYPYSKFALVENFWETGYGMPSFTLLGSKVIRLPFILTTSYPHEILHDWWGNGVYVAPEGGNWSEGLTAYLADHLFAEQKGGGAAYRQETLQKYGDYVSSAKDFPLREFRERHSPSTEAVGYGKALMLFHMLRRELGDDVFVRGLRGLFQSSKFRRASFQDVRAAFEAAAGRDLAASFAPWVDRTGAPRLRLTSVGATEAAGGWRLTGTIDQSQDGEPYALAVPLAVTLEGRDAAMQTVVRAAGRSAPLDLTLPARPLRLDVDPEFDLFRALDPEEVPPALSGAFGDASATLVLPAGAPADLLAAYRAMAVAWNTGRAAPMRIVTDAELASAPPTGSLFIVGFENRLLAVAEQALAAYPVAPARQGDRAIALVARRPGVGGAVVAFVAAQRAAQVAGLARKLPHYHKYSSLAFEGDEPVNVAKERWAVTGSPLCAVLVEGSKMGTLAPRPALAELPPAFSKERMIATVAELASPAMRGRGAGTPELDRAADSIAAAMRSAGLELLPPDPAAKNVIGVLRGTKPEWAEQSVVVGAHYDHLGTGADGVVRPGADDNASGVAVLLELARQMAAAGPQPRAIVFAAFADEETGRLGSKRYVARAAPWPASKTIGMVNLDTVGRLRTGKLLVLGTGTAGEWIHIVNGAGYVTGVPVEGVAGDPGGSDQASFTEAGVPAIQLFTGANVDYHAAGDTPDKIDGDGLVKVAAVARECVAYLATRDRPLSAAIGGASPAAASGAPRRASLGTVPDYAFAGPGVRIGGTTPGSPAEAAGLREGDVIVGLGDRTIATLAEFSEALKSLPPGAKVTVVFRRDGVVKRADAVLTAR